MPDEDLIDATSAYTNLGPDQILDAIESIGYRTDGRMLALNSYENRVYQIGIEDAQPLIAKFYRPARWSDEAILEEHHYTHALAEAEIPVIAPLADENGLTLHHHKLHRFSLFIRRGGHSPELDDPDTLEQLGRFVARMHLIGETTKFLHRPTVSIQDYALTPGEYLMNSGFIPKELQAAYQSLLQDLVSRIEDGYKRAGKIQTLRLHGDCHPGNILWRDDAPHIVDFDDARSGPAIQDLWMFLSGDRAEMTHRLADLLEGYTQFREFEPRELHLLEPLRTLRMIHYAGWLAKRWDDPAFPNAFPWFNTPRYWDEHILCLREQLALLEEPPLVWD
jgi:Ser/Thr protein kinase RdoA (MazF antagonist)